jgi:hypothetical protein
MRGLLGSGALRESELSLCVLMGHCCATLHASGDLGTLWQPALSALWRVHCRVQPSGGLERIAGSLDYPIPGSRCGYSGTGTLEGTQCAYLRFYLFSWPLSENSQRAAANLATQLVALFEDGIQRR